MLLTGEAGIGKSRIVEALVEAVAGAPHATIRFQCTPYHTDSALYPAIQYLTQHLALADGDAATTPLARIEALLARAGLPGGETAGLFAALLGVPAGARPRHGQPDPAAAAGAHPGRR